MVARGQSGGRRYARNWAVRIVKEDITCYRESGEETAKPSLAGLRKRWNQVKDTECVDRETGQVWWPEISKEAFADGIRAAVDGYWNWQQLRPGRWAGRGSGSPASRKRAVTGSIAEGTRLIAAFRVLVQRPQQPVVINPDSRVGVDVAFGAPATVADSRGEVHPERVANPRPSEAALKSCGTCRGGNRDVAAVLAATSNDAADFPASAPGRRHPRPSPPCPEQSSRRKPTVRSWSKGWMRPGGPAAKGADRCTRSTPWRFRLGSG